MGAGMCPPLAPYLLWGISCFFFITSKETRQVTGAALRAAQPGWLLGLLTPHPGSFQTA